MPLIRVISNFVSNAVKHCPQGTVLIGCRRLPGQLRIDVVDNGPGIPAQQLQTLQQAYQKGKDSAGEGLGLAINKQLADEMGWEIEIASEAGKGSRFSLTLTKATQSS